MDCPHISSSVCIAAVNLSQLQILREYETSKATGVLHLRRTSYTDYDEGHWNCVSCNASESPNLCLACGLIFCGRYVNGHGVMHDDQFKNNNPRHCLMMNCYTFELFCNHNKGHHTELKIEWFNWRCWQRTHFSYACDDSVYGDTDDGKIASVRKSLQYFSKTRSDDHSYSSFFDDQDDETYHHDDGIDLGTEEEDELTDETQQVADRIRELNEEDSSSVPEEDAFPISVRMASSQQARLYQPLKIIPQSLPQTSTTPSTNDSSPQFGGRTLRPRKRRPSFVVSSPSPSPSPTWEPKQSRGAKTGQRTFEDSKYRGLKNVGNTCFMNSVIQAVNAVDPFRAYLTRLPELEPDDIVDEHQPLASPRYNTRRAASVQNNVTPEFSPRATPSVLAEELRLILLELGKSNSNQAISPDDFIQVVWKVNVRFRGYQQQDAHEFLRAALDRMHSELRRCRIPETADVLLADMCGVRNLSANSSAITVLFEGALQSQVVCLTCHTASNKQDPFMDLSLDILPPTQGGAHRGTLNTKLTECIHRFFAKEELDQCEQYTCGNCRDKRPSTKQLFLRVLPNVLCLHLKRFRWSHSHASRGKLDNMVEFPLTGLDMSQFMAPTPGRGNEHHSQENVTYNLSSIVVHHGSGVSSGHYTAYALRNGKWFHFNDMSVKPATEATVLKQKAYILFYTRSMRSEGHH